MWMGLAYCALNVELFPKQPGLQKSACLVRYVCVRVVWGGDVQCGGKKWVGGKQARCA